MFVCREMFVYYGVYSLPGGGSPCCRDTLVTNDDKGKNRGTRLVGVSQRVANRGQHNIYINIQTPPC